MYNQDTPCIILHRIVFFYNENAESRFSLKQKMILYAYGVVLTSNTVTSGRHGQKRKKNKVKLKYLYELYDSLK